MPTTEEWEEIGRKLREPFDPREVEFKVQTNPGEGKTNGLVVPFVDARAIQDRLDDVVGAGNWSFDWTPLVTEKGDVQIAKGVLTLHGITKADVGTAGNHEPSKAAVSDALKRAAVQWGISRYLYGLDTFWAALEKRGNYWHIPDAEMAKLRSKLPRPSGSATPRQHQASQPSASLAAASGPSVGTPTPPEAKPEGKPDTEGGLATPQQMASIQKLCMALGKPEPEDRLSFGRAKALLAELAQDYDRARRNESGRARPQRPVKAAESIDTRSLTDRWRDTGITDRTYDEEMRRVIPGFSGILSPQQMAAWRAHLDSLERQIAPAVKS